MYKKMTLVAALLLGLQSLAASKPKQPEPAPELRIELTTLGYPTAKEVRHSNREVFHDLTLLMQDEDRRLSFVGENMLALYFNRLPEKSADGTSTSYPMEVFFLSADSGKLIERRTWSTLKRQWFNDDYDTEGRIVEVRSGFLVHAGAKLELYATDLRLLKSHDLKADSPGNSGMWSVKVAPGGDTIHVQPFEQATQVRQGAVSYFRGGGEAEGSWLRSDSFQKIGSQLYPGGIHSVSRDAIVGKQFRCLDLKRVGESWRHLSCSLPVANGFPMFLTDDEILSVGVTGFSVLSTEGRQIWDVGEPDPGAHRALRVEGERRSMDGSRFAISVTAYKKKVELDGIHLARLPLHTIVVYDRRCRKHVFSLTTSAYSPDAFALSPEGQTLAVFAGTTISVYTLPEASCGNN